MKFIVSQSALATALSVVSKGMGSNASLPILAGIYIKADEGTLEFQTTNLDISIRHRIPANVEEPGEVVVSGKILNNIVKTLADAAVTFEGEGTQVSISCEKSNFLLNTLDPRDFPEFPEYELDTTIELPSDLLSKMVDKVYKVTVKDNTRPILSGVLLTVENNTIRLVATDSYRLAVCDSNTETSSAAAPFRTIVSGAVFHDVLSLPSMTEKLLIGITGSQVVFQFGNTTYVSRKIEGRFPDYKQLFPDNCSTSVRIGVDRLSSALKRVSVIALANPSVHFEVDADGALMRLSASSPDQGESHEDIPVEVEGDSCNIALNYHYVFDCVNAISGTEDVTLELQSAVRPAIFKAFGKINYQYLLMQMRS
jgi:DNA polymerase-3 subunit beta